MPDPGVNTMKHLLDAARDGDLAKAIAAGAAAADVMATADDTTQWMDAASALGAAFVTIQAHLLAGNKRLAREVEAHKATLTGSA